jgi:hypothetical protein
VNWLGGQILAVLAASASRAVDLTQIAFRHSGFGLLAYAETAKKIGEAVGVVFDDLRIGFVPDCLSE